MGEVEAQCAPATIGGPSRRLVLFGDTVGLPQLLRVVAPSAVTALVAASVRPAQHAVLTELAERHTLPLLLQPLPRAPDYAAFIGRLRELAPDLLLVNSYAMILRPDALAVPRFGAVNIHGALLPAYRGANPTEWAVINGERETGVTIHAVDAGIDTGPIIAQRKVPIRFEDTWLDVRRRVGAATEQLLADMLPAILGGMAGLQPQLDASRRHWRRRTAEDGRFDWSQPAIDIYNLVRALVDPHPGASCGGETIRHWLPLDEILWRKYRSGRGRWSNGAWELVPRRPAAARDPRRAGAALMFDLHRRAGIVGHCSLAGIAEAGPLGVAVEFMSRARISLGAREAVYTLASELARGELRRDTVFC
jgi:methionyl-tRNA formyltransferase